MIRIGILGDIGSGKSYVAKNFRLPLFNADDEVRKLYKNDKKTFYKLKKILPKYFTQFPINKSEIIYAILSNKQNLKKIIKIVHVEVKKKMKIFLKKNKNKKFVILDIPLLLENKLCQKNDILVFVKSKKYEILKRLKKRKNFNKKIFQIFRRIQLPLDYKEKKSHYVIKNNFSKKSVKNDIKKILKGIL